MEKYQLTPSDIETGIKRVLTEAYASSTISTTPTIIYISAGPGAGKTALVNYFRKKFRENDEKPYILNSDKIAEFHPNYEEALEELPEECYRITRQFVRPATPRIFDELMKSKVNIINENTLDKGEYDIDMARKLKQQGYKISVNIMATDLFECRISCYERDAAMLLAGMTPRGCSIETQNRMYNSFVTGVRNLQHAGLSDNINVFTRGENINKIPILKYSSSSKENTYFDFEDAIRQERAIQRRRLISDPSKYLNRIKDTKDIISEYSMNEALRNNSLKALNELQSDFIRELGRVSDREI